MVIERKNDVFISPFMTMRLPCFSIILAETLKRTVTPIDVRFYRSFSLSIG